MTKLQLRLNVEQADLILRALHALVTYGPYSEDVGPAASLESWLRWRRDKVFGPPAGSTVMPDASEALDQLRAKLAR